MTETERKALALVNEIAGHDFVHPRDMGDKSWLLEALCRAIEQHEAFRHEVSDAMLLLQKHLTGSGWGRGDRINLLEIPGSGSVNFDRFIIAKPDPLVEVLNDMKDGRAGPTTESYAACLRATIEKRGGKIVWGEGE